jgi:hypothetical protein
MSYTEVLLLVWLVVVEVTSRVGAEPTFPAVDRTDGGGDLGSGSRWE